MAYKFECPCLLDLFLRPRRVKHDAYIAVFMKFLSKGTNWKWLRLLVSLKFYEAWNYWMFLIIPFSFAYTFFFWKSFTVYTLIIFNIFVLDNRSAKKSHLSWSARIDLLLIYCKRRFKDFMALSKPAFTCSKLTIETLEQGVKCVQI